MLDVLPSTAFKIYARRKENFKQSELGNVSKTLTQSENGSSPSGSQGNGK
jgi:hypothetical protein